MNRARRVVRGASAQVLAQLLVGVGQVVYAGITARFLAPSDFGDFAVAMNLASLLVLLSATGLPSFVLQSRELSSSLVTRVRAVALFGGVVAAAALWFGLPYWGRALNSPGSQQFELLLVCYVAVAPLSAVESGLFRREGRTVTDAIVLLSAFLVGAGVALCAIIRSGRVESLAFAPLVTGILVLVASGVLRRHRYAMRWRAQDRLGAFSRRVTTQNSIFYVLTWTPLWVLGAATGTSAVGQFSRASALTSTGSNSIGYGLTRSLQPNWRTVDSEHARGVILRDALTLTLGVSVTVFGLIAVIAGRFVRLWLGPGWEPAAHMAIALAIGCLSQVPYVVLSNALEMMGKFGDVRRSQVAIGFGLVPGLLLLVLTRNPIFAAVAVAISQTAGLSFLLLAVAGRWKSTVPTIVAWPIAQALWCLLPLAVAATIVAGAAPLFGTSTAGGLAQMMVAVGVVGGVSLLLFRFQPAYRVLRARGIFVRA